MKLIARTGQEDVNSNESKCALMDMPIGAAESAFYEAHIRIDEGQQLLLAGLSVCLCHIAADVPTHESIEVRDGSRLGDPDLYKDLYHAVRINYYPPQGRQKGLGQH